MPQTFVEPARYHELLDKKVSAFKAQLADAALKPIIKGTNHRGFDEILKSLAVFESPKTHYRQRTEFKIWHEGDRSHFAMTDQQTKKPIFIERFPVASETINSLMTPILEAINCDEVLRKKLFQMEFLSTQTGDTLVTMIYHRPLDEDWQAAATVLKDQLGVHLIGRSRKQKMVLDQDFVEETLSVDSKDFHYQQIEGSFTQPNAAVCEKMLTWAVEHSRGAEGDLLELYCGNGNFTLPLAQNFDRVLATEISKTSVKSAQVNIAKNAVNNVDILRLSSEEFVQAWDKVRDFNRLKGFDLDSYQFNTVFVDPPRAGLDTATEAMVKRFERIIYISCNPSTLCHNLKTLCKTHQIEALAAFDQFPYTDHLETGVILRAKTTKS